MQKIPNAPRTILDVQGKHKRPLVSPNIWVGQPECTVGPFSSKPVAEYVATKRLEQSRLAATNQILYARGDAWYIQVDA